MRYFFIDIGTKNLAWALFFQNGDVVTRHEEVVDHVQYFKGIISEYESTPENTVFIIERQMPRALTNRDISYTLFGMFLGLGYKSGFCQPHTQGKKLDTYSKRKRYAVDKLSTLCNDLKIPMPKNKKKDDYADSILLGLKYLPEFNICNISFK